MVDEHTREALKLSKLEIYEADNYADDAAGGGGGDEDDEFYVDDTDVSLKKHPNAALHRILLYIGSIICPSAPHPCADQVEI